MAHYEELEVFHKAHSLCIAVYRITRHYPDDEKFGLVSQLRRASSSIPANIVESSKFRSNKNSARFIEIAIGSADEVGYFLRLSIDLGILSEKDGRPLIENAQEVARMLTGLKSSLLKSTRRLTSGD